MSDPAAYRLNAALEGRYRIERQLGAGGMATVYLAEDLKHERKVAVKVLRPDLAALLGGERFIQEIKTTASLQHPHILPLFDSGDADGFLFYVMPFVEGETLRDKLDREAQLGVEEAVRITREVADALDYAHRQGIIHRDIKPANILLHDGRSMVADFGIALALSAAAGGRMTETGASIGTPHYMSPEQATADREITGRSDVYSLASVLYEMLAGEPPHSGANAQAVIMKIIADRPRPVAELRASVPPHVQAALTKALEKLPADRFQGAREFAVALADPGFRYGRAGETSEAGAAASSRPGGLVAGLASMVVLLAAGLGWTLVRLGTSDTTPEPVSRFDLTSTVGTLSNAGGVELDISEDGRRIVFAAVDSGGTSRLWIRDLDDLDPEPIPGTGGADSPVLSPDGRVLAFVRDAAIHTMTLPDGPPLRVAAGLFPAWGDDGALYFADDLVILRVPPGGGPAEPFTASTGVAQMVPDPLPRGRGLLLTVRRQLADRSRIAVVGPGGGAVREILDGTQARYLPTGHILYTQSDGTLLVAEFDLETLEAGPATPVVSGVQIDGNSATQFAVSGSGSLVFQTALRGRDAQLVWVDRDGRVEPVDTTGSLGFLAISPDGTRVVGRSGGDVVIKPLAGGPEIRIEPPGDPLFHPAWTPDGDSVLVNQDTLWTLAADGGGRPVYTHYDPRGIVAPNWSPAGEWLVYRTSLNLAGSGDIMGIRPGRDSVATSLVATEGFDAGPAVSPDGRWLAYSTGLPGESASEVYVVPFPDVGGGRWRVGEGGNPIWSRDGTELYYGSFEGLMAARVQTDPTFRVLSTQRLPTPEGVSTTPGLDAGYDVAPDGRFLTTRLVGEPEEARVILIQNLFALLAELR